MDYFLDVQQTAELLKTTPARIYNSLSRKEFPSHIFTRFGRKILFKKDAVINWIESGKAA